MVTFKNYSMTLYEFLNNALEVPCYIDRNEPSDVLFPYASYELPFTSYNEQLIAVKIRTNDGKLTTCVKYVDKLKDIIGQGYKLNTGTGYIVIRQGEPFAQVINEEIGEHIKTVYVNLSIQIF